MEKEYRVTISLPCYLRPLRIVRALESCLDQNISKYEIILTGDNCPIIEYWVHHTPERFEEIFKRTHRETEISVIVENLPVHTGAWGYEIRNRHIQEAKGEYFVFMGSDDVILPNHLENYLSQIEGTDLDFVYFDSWVEPYNAPRNAQLKHGMIGHSELIVRTEFLKQMPPHDEFYGHDWRLIENMIKAGAKYKKGVGCPQTYIVKSVRGNEEKNID